MLLFHRPPTQSERQDDHPFTYHFKSHFQLLSYLEGLIVSLGGLVEDGRHLEPPLVQLLLLLHQLLRYVRGNLHLRVYEEVLSICLAYLH